MLPVHGTQNVLSQHAFLSVKLTGGIVSAAQEARSTDLVGCPTHLLTHPAVNWAKNQSSKEVVVRVWRYCTSVGWQGLITSP